MKRRIVCEEKAKSNFLGLFVNTSFGYPGFRQRAERQGESVERLKSVFRQKNKRKEESILFFLLFLSSAANETYLVEQVAESEAPGGLGRNSLRRSQTLAARARRARGYQLVCLPKAEEMKNQEP